MAWTTFRHHGRRSQVEGQSGAAPNPGFHLTAAPVAQWAEGGSMAQPQVNPRPLGWWRWWLCFREPREHLVTAAAASDERNDPSRLPTTHPSTAAGC